MVYVCGSGGVLLGVIRAGACGVLLNDKVSPLSQSGREKYRVNMVHGMELGLFFRTLLPTRVAAPTAWRHNPSQSRLTFTKWLFTFSRPIFAQARTSLRLGLVRYSFPHGLHVLQVLTLRGAFPVFLGPWLSSLGLPDFLFRPPYRKLWAPPPECPGTITFRF